jgi:hypothetical protein
MMIKIMNINKINIIIKMILIRVRLYMRKMKLINLYLQNMQN